MQPQRTADGRKIEYDKNGQPWTFDAATMAWTPLAGGIRVGDGDGGGGIVGGEAGHHRRTTPPRGTYELDAADYDDRTDTSEYGNGLLSDRSIPSPPRPLTLPPMAGENNTSAVRHKANAAPAEGGVRGSIDNVVDQILERRSARLEGRPPSRAAPSSAATPRESQASTVRWQDAPHEPQASTVRWQDAPQGRNTLTSLDLESSSLPERNYDLDLNTGVHPQRSYTHSPALTPDEEISPPFLADQRKHLWQNLRYLTSLLAPNLLSHVL